LNIILDTSTEFILDNLEKAGFSAYVVGGSLRDILLGMQTHDIDITTSATPEQVKQIFSSYIVIETGIKHGTVTLLIEHIPYEITTFRTEGTYSDSRRPDSVFFTDSIEEDLKRRDFTINALAYSPKSGLIDLFGGLADLDNKVLKAVGNPTERFSEDALRIMRGLRFASVLGFCIEQKTENAMLECSNLLKIISVERIYNELLRMLSGKNFDAILREFFLIFKLMMPEIELPEKDITLLPEPIFRLAALFQSEADARKCLRRLKSDNDTLHHVLLLVGSSPIPYDVIEIKRFLSKNYSFALDISLYHELFYGEVGSYERMKNVIDSGECYSLGQLAVNGSDIVALGFNGSNVGKILEILLENVIVGNLINEKTALISAVKNIDNQ